MKGNLIRVRAVHAADKERWLELWNGYLTFYKNSLSEEQNELTWNRLLDPNYESHGLVAELNGNLVGITHYAFQTSTWSPVGYCYLEDLFVDPNLRGQGAGRALIDEVKRIAIAAGATRLYWNTDKDNETARKLYDSYGPEAGKVQYRIPLN
jgi:ribosomal protein S18 acetylase RimI-like enzyme